MNKADVTNFFKGVRSTLTRHAPEILTGVGIVGMWTAVGLAINATPKALQLIEEKKDEEGVDELTPLETVKAAWKPYVPALATGVLSTTCLIGASSVNAKRNAALTAAYALSETALRDYREKVVETIGEKKEQGVRDKVAQKKVDEHPVSKTEVIVTGAGGVLFLEPVSMRYFHSDIEHIRKIVNDINYRLTSGMEEYVSLSEFYDEIGLSHTDISDELGWNIGRDGQLEIRMPATTADDGRPCLMLEYSVSPRRGYGDLA